MPVHHDDKPIWERLDKEPLLSYRRFERFRLMEPVRSIVAVYREEMRGNERITEAPSRWYIEAKKWQWQERALAWDAYLDEQIEQQIALERKKALRKGYALMHKRVDALSSVAEQLKKYMLDETRVWLPDAKIVATGNGESARVDLEIFNDGLFKEFREYLDDIAEEMEERVTPKASVSVKSEGSMEFEVEWGGGRLDSDDESG